MGRLEAHVTTLLLLTIIAAQLSHAAVTPNYDSLTIDGLYARDMYSTRARPNWAFSGPTNIPLPTFLAEHQRCHENMTYVVRNGGSPLYLPRPEDGGVAYTQSLRDVVLGCCNEGTIGCTWPGIDRVIGCCPIGKQCVLQHSERHGVARPIFVGCVDHVAQKCGTTMCPPGHICCPHADIDKSRCVPGTPDQPMADVCGEAVAVRPKLHVQEAHVRDYQLYVRGPPPFTGNVTKALVDGVNTTVAYDEGLFLCKYSNRRCRLGLDHCSVHVDQVFIVVNETLVFVKNKTNAVHCCPNTFEVCLSSDGDYRSRMVGCVDVVGGEQCCGKQICPSGQQCCPAPPSSQPIGGGPNTKHCCSIWETCCYSPTYGSYCGKEVDGDPCGADSRAPPHWWALRPPNV